MKTWKNALANSILVSLMLTVTAVLPGMSCANGGNGTYSADPIKSSGKGRAEKSEKPSGGSERINSPKKPGSMGVGASPGNSSELMISSERRFDFTANVTLAHLRSSGLLLDFGDASRNKYTVGDWKTGWRGNHVLDGTTVSFLEGKAARLFFFLNDDESGNGKLVIRARGPGQKVKGRLYLNGKGLGPVEFESTFSHVTVDAEGLLKSGNNELLWRPGNGATVEDGQYARLVVDYVRVIPEGTDDAQAASSVSSVMSASDGGESSALRLREGDRLTWYLPIPKDAFIRMEARSSGESGSAKMSLGIARRGLPPRKVMQTTLDDKGSSGSAPLTACDDDICAVDLQVRGGEAIFETLEMRVPKRDAPKASGKRGATNVVLVLIDTLRADHLSVFNRETRVQTPFLKKLAEESMVFENAWAQENWTKPSVTSLLSGLYSATHQNKTESNKVPATVVMIQEHLQRLGFETAGFVANGYVSDKFGFRRGWDTWTNYVREGKRNRAEFVAEDAVKWLKTRNDDKPFFLYVHTIDPHVPYIPPASYRAMYDNEPYNGIVKSTQTASLLEKVKTGALRLSDRDKFRLEALYDGEISYHDDHLVKVYDELKAQGLLENTVLVITSDHGEEFFEHGSVGHGHSLYEELLHVPLIVRLPDATGSSEARFSEMVELVDVVPTLCALTGVAQPEGVQGNSLTSQLSGVEPDWPNAAFSEFMDGQITARTTRYKLIYRGLSTTLFDLKNDPRETADLSDERPDAFVAMRDIIGLHMGRFVPSGELSSSRAASKTPSEKSRPVHQRENATIDAETRKQLKALGYMGD